MSWKLHWSERSLKQLRKIDPYQREIILRWMSKNIADCSNPRAYGKELTANRKNQWRYRIGQYRVLCEIHDHDLVVLALEVGHRSKIYR